MDASSLIGSITRAGHSDLAKASTRDLKIRVLTPVVPVSAVRIAVRMDSRLVVIAAQP